MDVNKDGFFTRGAIDSMFEEWKNKCGEKANEAEKQRERIVKKHISNAGFKEAARDPLFVKAMKELVAKVVDEVGVLEAPANRDEMAECDFGHMSDDDLNSTTVVEFLKNLKRSGMKIMMSMPPGLNDIMKKDFNELKNEGMIDQGVEMSPETMGELTSPMIDSVADVIMEYEQTYSEPPNYEEQTLHSATRIFMSCIMDRMWGMQENEGMDMEDRKNMAISCGKEVAMILKKYAGLSDLNKK